VVFPILLKRICSFCYFAKSGFPDGDQMRAPTVGILQLTHHSAEKLSQSQMNMHALGPSSPMTVGIIPVALSVIDCERETIFG
jgi:hypothetical protein